MEAPMNSRWQLEALKANKEFYANYWAHPWKYRLMYDMQIKMKLFLFAVRSAEIELHGKKVLDIGFGSGRILFAFDTSCDLYGVDFSLQAVENARRRALSKGYRTASFFQMDLDFKSLPLNDRSMDVVICSHVLEHVVDDGKVLRDIHRVLKDDGSAVILVPLNEEPGQDPHHLRVYRRDSFLSKLKELGFKKTFSRESEYLGHFTHWFFLRQYHKRIPVLGALISAALNIPLALAPFSVHRLFDRLLSRFGFLPRQAVFCVSKADNSTTDQYQSTCRSSGQGDTLV